MTGEFVCGPISVEDARVYDDFSARAARLMQELMDQGRLPEAASVLDFIAVTRRCVSTVRAEAESAAKRGETTVIGRFPLSASEHRMLTETGASLAAVMEIMVSRGTLDLAPPAAAAAFAAAMAEGTFHP